MALTEVEQAELDQINRQYYAPGLTQAEQAELDQINKQYYAPKEATPQPEESTVGGIASSVGNALWEGVKGIPEAAQSMLDPITQGLTFGFGDEISGAIEAPLNKIMNPNMGLEEAYKFGRDNARKRYANSKEVAPVSSFIAETAGSIASGAPLFKAAGALTSMPRSMGAGALESIAIGQGKEDEGYISPDKAVEQGLWGAAGAGIGTGLQQLLSPSARNAKAVKDALDINYPLKTSDINHSKFIQSAENVLDYTIGTPYADDLARRGEIVNQAIATKANIGGDKAPVKGVFKKLGEAYDTAKSPALTKAVTKAQEYNTGRMLTKAQLKTLIKETPEVQAIAGQLRKANGNLNPINNGKDLLAGATRNVAKYNDDIEAFAKATPVYDDFISLSERAKKKNSGFTLDELADLYADPAQTQAKALLKGKQVPFTDAEYKQFRKYKRNPKSRRKPQEVNASNIDMQKVLADPTMYNSATGEVDLNKLTTALQKMDPNSFGPAADDAFGKVMKLADQFPPIAPRETGSALNTLASITGQSALTGLGYGLSGSALGAVLTPVGLTQTLKGLNYLARKPELLSKLAPGLASQTAKDYEDWDTMDYVNAGLWANPVLKATSGLARTALGVPTKAAARSAPLKSGFKTLDNIDKASKLLGKRTNTALDIARGASSSELLTRGKRKQAQKATADSYDDLMNYIKNIGQ